MKLRDKVEIWWSLSWYGRWELLGVYARLRCSACGDWKWRETCHTQDHQWSLL